MARDLERRHGAEVDPETVLITPGAKPVMFFAALLLGEPGAEILYPNPGFPIYESVIRFSPARRPSRSNCTRPMASRSTPTRCSARSMSEPA